VPEILEIEYYRRAAESVLGRVVEKIHAPDDWYLKAGTAAAELGASLVGRRFIAARRRGKLLLLDTDDGEALGLRFGMTGRLVVDGSASIEQLEYSSDRDDPAWDRFGISFDRGELWIRDPRRLGGVMLGPDEAALGPDALSLALAELRKALGSSTTSLKARLLDQRRVAGLGNLLTDEVLWRTGLAPVREAGSLGADEVDILHRGIGSTLDELLARGGSHTGDLQEHRVVGGRCPRDGEELRREAVGGRTTYWCPAHQG